MSSRCQRSSVSGVTKKVRQEPRPSSRLAAARKKRSAGLWLGSHDLTAQNVKLVAQHDDLNLLGLVRARAQQNRF
jgi:hypothetical protein